MPSPLTAARRLELLEPPADHVRMVLDTDTYNEIDDQFALVYALLSPERITCEAIYAAVRERPDVCLLDIAMPGGGISAAEAISAEVPGLRS